MSFVRAARFAISLGENDMGHRAIFTAAARSASHLFTSLIVALSACGCGGERDPGVQDVASTPAESISGVSDAPSETPGTSRPSLRATDGPIVRAGEDGITVLALQAPRLALLREVRDLAGFRLEIAEGVSIDGTVTVEAVDATLDDVLRDILDEVPYAVFHGVDAKSAGPVVELVFVGEFSGLPAVAEAALSGPEEARPRRPEKRVRTEEERRLSAERRERDDVVYLAQLDDPDVSARAEAAEWIRATDETIPALANVLAADPEPTVRAAAAETLGEASNSSEGLSALLRALEDPEPQVVISALDAIEFVADQTVIPELGFLLSHPDEEVRERTVEAIEWLEE